MSTTTTLYRAQLTLERGAIINQLYSLGRQASGSSLQEQIRLRLQRIDTALRQIEAGEYEVCDYCDAPVVEEQAPALGVSSVVCRACERQIQ